MTDRVDLNGEWQLSQHPNGSAIPSSVPGCVHTDLLAAGLIDEPYERDNEVRLQWIGEVDWVYSRTFDVPASMLARDKVVLRCLGLDTLATVTINGKTVGRPDNMFRTWEFGVKEVLRSGENEIVIHFHSTLPYIARRQKERHLDCWAGWWKVDGQSWVRKEPCNFGWDWGPRLITCGIWRDIEIVGFDLGRIANVEISQHHRRGRVDLDVAILADLTRRSRLSATVSLTLAGRTVAEAAAPLRRGKAVAALSVTGPELWWPRGMGGQPLYEMRLDLVDSVVGLVDTQTRRIGLRTLELVRKKDRWGESFHFAANGTAFFAKGANWIPADTFQTRMTADRYRGLLQSAAEANMNMLRVWGGGVYEEDAFYDLCDELGICIWQDFMFACAAYPSFDEEFMASVEAEAGDNVRRLRDHPSIALWCGNNELEMGLVDDEWSDRAMSWADYTKLFDKLLERVVAQLDPQRSYWPSSPHTPHGDRRDANDPRCGDAHLWGVWHGRRPFEWYRGCTHRFNSEFGFQSFPEPRTVRGYTEDGDRNLTSPVMEHHQRSGIGNAVIVQYMLDWFRMPTGFENTLWVSQILQGIAIKYAVEHWRRSMPRGMGTLYWQLNDCWPVASWSSIDYHGRWKALHYLARRFYAPLLISAVEDLAKGRADIFVTSDDMKARSGRISWTLTTADGRALAASSQDVEIPGCRSARAVRLDLRDSIDACGAENLMLFMELTVCGEIVSANFASFARPKRMELSDPEIIATVRPIANGVFNVRLAARRPALWTWLGLADVDAAYSDNFFHLHPGSAVDVLVTPTVKMTRARLVEKLEIRSLVDTY